MEARTIRVLAATVFCLAVTGAVRAEDIKIGVEMGFTGPIAALTPPMARAAELAIKEVNASGLFLGETKLVPVRADDTCVDLAAAVATAERLIASDKVSGIVGPTCSATTRAVLKSVAIPRGMVLISPSATASDLSSFDSKGLFLPLAPSDAREGEILAEIMKQRGVRSAAIVYAVNDHDYGRSVAAAIQASFVRLGGKVTISAPHEEGKDDYSALAAAGGDAIVVAGYSDRGGAGIVKGVLNTGAFSRFVFPSGMWGASLKTFGGRLEGAFGDIPGNDSAGESMLLELTKAAGVDGTAAFAPESYDAAAIMILAMQAAVSPSPAEYKRKIKEVTSGPGERIYPGELAKGLELLKAGRRIRYVGASGFRLVGDRENGGAYREVEVRHGEMTTIKYR
jgi:branched-chain amino acid transport system substrate-binding protein